MTTLKTAAVLAALASGSISLLGASSGNAAVLSVGPSNAPYGAYQCADVRGASLTNLTPIQAYDCHAGANQQYQLIYTGGVGMTIYALGAQRCVDVTGAGKAAGTLVESYPCNGTVAQKWYYWQGELYNPNSAMCLDAGNIDNGTQLRIEPCNLSKSSQNWQIK